MKIPPRQNQPDSPPRGCGVARLLSIGRDGSPLAALTRPPKISTLDPIHATMRAAQSTDTSHCRTVSVPWIRHQNRLHAIFQQLIAIDEVTPEPHGMPDLQGSSVNLHDRRMGLSPNGLSSPPSICRPSGAVQIAGSISLRLLQDLRLRTNQMIARRYIADLVLGRVPVLAKNAS